jgi:hypothetical protein
MSANKVIKKSVILYHEDFWEARGKFDSGLAKGECLPEWSRKNALMKRGETF